MAGADKNKSPPPKGGKLTQGDPLLKEDPTWESFREDQEEDEPDDSGDNSDNGRVTRKETPVIGPPALLDTPAPAPGPRAAPPLIVMDSVKRTSTSEAPADDVNYEEDQSDAVARDTLVPHKVEKPTVVEVEEEDDEDEAEMAMTPPPIPLRRSTPTPKPLVVPPPDMPTANRGPITRTKTEESPPPKITTRTRSPAARGATMSEDAKDTHPPEGPRVVPPPADNTNFFQRAYSSWKNYDNTLGSNRRKISMVAGGIGVVVVLLVCLGLLYNYGGSLTNYGGGFKDLPENLWSAMGGSWQEKKAAEPAKTAEQRPVPKPPDPVQNGNGSEEGVLVLASLDQRFDTKSRGQCVYFDLSSKLTKAGLETIRVCDPALTVTEKKEVQVAGKPVHMEDIISGLKAQEGKIKNFKLAVGAEVACTGLAYMNGEAPCTMKFNPDRPKPPPVKAEVPKPKPAENPPPVKAEDKAAPEKEPESAPSPPPKEETKTEPPKDSSGGSPPPPVKADIRGEKEAPVNDDTLPTSSEGEKKE